MDKLKVIVLSLLLALSAVAVKGQTPSVKAEIDSAVLLIGEQAHLVFKVQNGKNQIVPPMFADSIVSNLEIVERSVDTTQDEMGSAVCYRFTVTAFDSALFYIPPFPFLIDGDTFLTNELSLKVVTIPVDTTDLAITDIKPIERAPFNWKEWAEYALYLLLAILLAYVGYQLYKRWKNRSNEAETEEQPEETRLPADEEALNALRLLKDDSLLSRGQYKLYQTRLVDILRVFIERTFEVPTMERTSDEILSSLSSLKKKVPETYSTLQHILHLADFVKFAKYNPPVDEHQHALTEAEEFVREASQWQRQQEALKQESENSKKK